jgi:hypothetical protein
VKWNPTLKKSSGKQTNQVQILDLNSKHSASYYTCFIIVKKTKSFQYLFTWISLTHLRGHHLKEIREVYGARSVFIDIWEGGREEEGVEGGGGEGRREEYRMIGIKEEYGIMSRKRGWRRIENEDEEEERRPRKGKYL